MLFVQAFVYVVVCVVLSASIPIVEDPKVVNIELERLKQWGYLDRSYNGKAASLKSSHQLSDAVKYFQRFFHMDETGVMNEQTRKLMETPRCGVPDVLGPPEENAKRRKRFNAQGSAWRNRNVTWKLENSNDDGITDAMVREFMRRSLQKWSDNANIDFIETPNAATGASQIRVRFETGDHGDGFPFDGPSGTLAHAFFPLNNLGLSGDIHFDDAEKYTTLDLPRSSGTIKLLWVAVHELGHSLGLSHSDLRGAIMYPFYLHFPGLDFNLTNDDVLGIQAVYGPRPLAVTTPTPPPKVTVLPKPDSTPSSTLSPSSTLPTPSVTPPKPTVGCTAQVQGVIMAGDTNPIVFDNGVLYKSDLKGVIELGPIKNERAFPKLSRVDAVHRKIAEKNDISFFHGDTFSVYRNQELLGNSRKITDGYQGLPDGFGDVDAALVWPVNNKLYLFKGEDYWRFTELESFDYAVDVDYPKKIRNHWTDVPDNIDASFTWSNGEVYFFKGDEYYRFNNSTLQVRSGYPRKNIDGFLKCPQQSLQALNELRNIDSSSASVIYTQASSLIVAVALWISFCMCFI